MLLPEARHRFKSYLPLHFKLLDNVVPPWRNWQTRWTQNPVPTAGVPVRSRSGNWILDRKSTRLNSSHVSNSYAVSCLNKKTKEQTTEHHPARMLVWPHRHGQ